MVDKIPRITAASRPKRGETIPVARSIDLPNLPRRLWDYMQEREYPLTIGAERTSGEGADMHRVSCYGAHGSSVWWVRRATKGRSHIMIDKAQSLVIVGKRDAERRTLAPLRFSYSELMLGQNQVDWVDRYITFDSKGDLVSRAYVQYDNDHNVAWRVLHDVSGGASCYRALVSLGEGVAQKWVDNARPTDPGVIPQDIEGHRYATLRSSDGNDWGLAGVLVLKDQISRSQLISPQVYASTVLREVQNGIHPNWSSLVSENAPKLDVGVMNGWGADIYY